MIRRSHDYRVEIAHNRQGGKGHVTFHYFYEPEDFLGRGRLFGKTIIEPGNSVGYHIHEGDQEAYYILKGKALYDDNGKKVELKSGDIGICKDGEGHSIENIGEGNLEYIMLILYS